MALQESKQLCKRARSEDDRFLTALIKNHKLSNSDFAVRMQTDEVIQGFSTASVYGLLGPRPKFTMLATAHIGAIPLLGVANEDIERLLSRPSQQPVQ